MSSLFRRVHAQGSLSILLLAGLLGVAGSSQPVAFPQKRTRHGDSEGWRRLPPKPGPSRPLKLPSPREFRLENGLKLIFVEDHRWPMVTVLAGIPLQLSPTTDHDAITKQVALADAAAWLLTEGAGSRNAEQLAREVETLGGRLSSSANDDYAVVTASVVAENIERMMDLLADVILHPTFPEDEVALYKRNRIQNLVVQRQDPAFLTGEQFDRVVFGSHPYAISSPTPASVEALDRPKIQRFYASGFAPKGSVVVIAGDFNPQKMEVKSRALFDQWKRPDSPAGAQSLDFPRPATRRVYLVDRPGSEQADFRVGGLGVTRAHPDYFALLVANAILGAGTNSRLFLNIRERKGFAYDVYSSVDPLRYAGTFFGGAQTRTEVTARAIKEMLAEFERLRNIKVTPREIDGAKKYLNGLFSLVLSTQGGVAERIAQTCLLDLGDNYLETYRARIDGVTAEQVQQAARKYIRPDSAVIVVVGEASKLKRRLASIGPVEMLTVEGKPAER